MKKSLVSILLSVSAMAQAQSLEFTQGQKLSHQSPRGVVEICRIPGKMAGSILDQSNFSKKDLEKEAELCGMNFYQTVGVCPKLNSTNPGTLVSAIPAGMDKANFEAKHCGNDDPQQKIQMKFKQSTSCSYAASGLAAYQLSRALGGIGNVPVTVVRTMDKQEHLKITNKALGILNAEYERSLRRDAKAAKPLILRTWETLANAHNGNPLSGKLFSVDGQLYGALSENPRGEDKYTEIGGVGAYETRYQRFLQQEPFKRVASPATVEQLAGGADLQKVLPMLIQMQDVSEMILMDTLLAQADRIGNIHFKFRWHFQENGKWTDAKSEAVRAVTANERAKANYKSSMFQAIVPAAELAAMKAKSAILVKEMMLKDNDCGVEVNPDKSKRRKNMMRSISALESVRHMSGKTYTNFMKLAQAIEANQEAAKNYFMSELLYRDYDFQGDGSTFMNNLVHAKQVLLNNCRSGQLKLDLNKKEILTGEKTNFSCEI